MVSDSSLVTKSLTADARTVIADLDFPVGWEIEKDEDEFFLRIGSHMFPALDESMEEQLIILWRHGVRGELTLHDIDSPYHFDRYTLIDEGVRYKRGDVVFEERSPWVHHRGGPFVEPDKDKEEERDHKL